jgi:hypothetical protein
VPPAVEVAPVNVAESVADPPAVIDVADKLVAIVGDAFAAVTVSCSLEHALLTPLLAPSPEYTACQKNVPAVGNEIEFDAGTAPLVTVTVPAACAPVVHVLFVYTV